MAIGELVNLRRALGYSRCPSVLREAPHGLMLDGHAEVSWA